MPRLAAIGLWAAITAAACGNPTRGGGADAGAVAVPADGVVLVARQPIEVGPRIAGALTPRESALISAEAAGSVLAVTVELGQRVEEGRVLARIENRAAADTLRSATSAVRSTTLAADNATRQAQRTRRLVQAGALPERDLETAENARAAALAALADARARLAAAREELAGNTVRAPLTGVISERSVNAGDVVAVGAPLFTVIDPRSMRLEASVPAEQLPAVAVGRTVTFTVRGYPDQSFEGHIERIAPAADPTTRQVRILVDIPNPRGRLIAGLFAEGRVTSERRNSLVVPANAVDLTGPTPTVARVREGKVERVAVELGLDDRANERVEIVAGLEPGDAVLVGAARALAPGTRVVLPPPTAGALSP